MSWTLWKLKRQLKSSSSATRGFAVERMAELGNAEVVEPLIAALEDSDEYVRQGAAAALGKIGDKRAVDRLIVNLIVTLPDKKSVRREAATALGKIGDARAIKPLVGALKDSDKEVRKEARKALETLRYEPADKMQQALMFIAYQRWDDAVELGADAIEPLLAALQDSDEAVRTEAEKALRKVGDEGVLKFLLAGIKDSDEDVRMRAIKALGWIGDGQAVEPLISALQDHSSYPAAVALGRIGDKRALGPLVAAYKDSLNDENFFASGDFAEILGKFDDPRAVTALISGLREAHVIKRGTAAIVLGKMGAVAVEPLIAAIKDPHKYVRQGAADALGCIGDARAVDPLIVALKDFDEDVRREAAVALGRIGDRRAIEPLRAALKTDLFFTAAGEALRNIRKESDVGGAVAKAPRRSEDTEAGESLNAIIIIFNREFSPKETFTNSILSKMIARGRPYSDWMTEKTPLRMLVNANAQDSTTYIAMATVQFRQLIGDQFNMDRLESATFEGSHGIAGVILSHWNVER